MSSGWFAIEIKHAVQQKVALGEAEFRTLDAHETKYAGPFCYF
jgi:hypothetical protein